MTKSSQKGPHFSTDEFGLIAEYFAPLAKSPGALGLLDDGAILQLEPDQELVMTADMIVSGVHFLPSAQAEEIAIRLLAVNVSDLAAMGAAPIGYLLSVALTDEQDGNWLARFSKRLERDQQNYDMVLLGGDTVSTPGPLTLNVTAFGSVPKGQALQRSHAQPGDAIYVSGTIGDSALGLMALQNQLPDIGEGISTALIERFQNPQPRVALGQSLRGIAGGVADISDGLLADLGHICKASNTGATLFAGEIPLSAAARTVLEKAPNLIDSVLSGGDDYELIFTISGESQHQFDQLQNTSALPLTQIGEISAGSTVEVRAENGENIDVKSRGYSHF
ncbi:MAG: thiamine-phosphate kinase [Rhodospirillaceae bacterium]